MPATDSRNASRRLPLCGAWLVSSVAFAFAFAPDGLADGARQLETDDDGAYVYSSRSLTSRRIGRLEANAPVTVRTCPDGCEDSGGFVAVEPFGFMIARNLRPRRTAPAPAPASYARIHRATDLRANADGTGHLRRMRIGHSIAILESTIGRPFAQRPDGTFVATEDITLHRPSAFSGERNPSGVIAFALRDERLADGTTFRRYERRAVESFDDTVVRVRGGSVPREAVRIARRATRPSEVPADASWVHVDVDEQVLTAYRGDRWEFATLVTSGSSGYPTVRGTFRVHQKTRSMTMVGDEPHNYLVESVDHVQFFQGGYALHAAYWHDHFGERGSHGCVNLAPADARFLFDWAPPSLPTGWGTIYPRHARVDRLYVTVE